MENKLKIEIVKWIDERELLTMIREKVFIEEQKVTSQLEWDGMAWIKKRFISWHLKIKRLSDVRELL
jgi:hypothetical protein